MRITTAKLSMKIREGVSIRISKRCISSTKEVMIYGVNDIVSVMSALIGQTITFSAFSPEFPDQEASAYRYR